MTDPERTTRLVVNRYGSAPGGHGFGTSAVFLASISTILGAILFLRFGYAVGHVGMFGALTIVLIGHMVTLPTALAVSEIATNRRVEGGGAYFIISRSFGRTIGASIGIALYLSQAISISFYMIAFAEAFRPVAPLFEQWSGLAWDGRMIALPGTALLCLLVVFRGANIGVKALWGIVAILALSLVLFFAGSPVAGSETGELAIFGGSRAATPSGWSSPSSFPPSPAWSPAWGSPETSGIRGARSRWGPSPQPSSGCSSIWRRW
ncbi:MAG: hypothetical protein R2862_07670 [Thermoanaerobaculia bacterium]